ncbi:magnesium transporter CorA family protein [Hydrocarboniphaga effusa]|uniref:magnesium transporter CorA family protein n=1 Tax=Hydrocarboniphaga effusa TaxID=243629 RepID=UPI0031383FF6
MDIFHLIPGQSPRRLDRVDELPEEGLLWIDFIRSDHQDWPAIVQPLVDAEIDVEHISDSLNGRHPPFFDGTGDYDMLIFEGLGPSDDPFPLDTRVGAMFLFDRLLVSVREADAPSYTQVQQRLANGRLKCPPTPVLLAQFILDAMVDRYLKVREVLDTRLTALQDDLLDPASPTKQWRPLLAARRVVRRLESLGDAQHEALDAWRRGSRFDWTQGEEVRFRDIVEHVVRVTHHAGNLERDVESAIDLHFAAMGYRTNRIMKLLTVISAIFFPLNFITSLYGMNFEYMPELHWRHGYFLVLGLLASIAAVLLLWFRQRRFF